MNNVQTKPAISLRSRTPTIPRDMELICAKCLAKDLRERYLTAAALADDLRRYLDGKPVLARPVGVVTQGAKWVRRNPIPTAFVAAVLLGCFATTAAALVARENARAAAAAEREQLLEKEKRGRAEREAAVAAAVQANDLQRIVDVVKAAEEEGSTVPAESRFAAAVALGETGN